MTTDKLETRECNVYCPAMLNVIPDLAYSVARVSIAPEMIVDHLEHSDAGVGLHRYALWGDGARQCRGDRPRTSI